MPVIGNGLQANANATQLRAAPRQDNRPQGGEGGRNGMQANPNPRRPAAKSTVFQRLGKMPLNLFKGLRAVFKSVRPPAAVRPTPVQLGAPQPTPVPPAAVRPAAVRPTPVQLGAPQPTPVPPAPAPTAADLLALFRTDQTLILENDGMKDMLTALADRLDYAGNVSEEAKVLKENEELMEALVDGFKKSVSKLQNLYKLMCGDLDEDVFNQYAFKCDRILHAAVYPQQFFRSSEKQMDVLQEFDEIAEKVECKLEGHEN